ncbi:hypothetical protein FRB98_000435 [Tulasnella sp. 332]|nr:hypothetical protein FRB98_000435 [Tulasnella sp. 332]
MALDYLDVFSLMNERADRLERYLRETRQENANLQNALNEARRELVAERERSETLERLVPALTTADALQKAAIRDLQFVSRMRSTGPDEEATGHDQNIEGLKSELLKRDRELTNAHRALFDLQAKFRRIRQEGNNTIADQASTRRGSLRPAEQILQKRKRHDSQTRSESSHVDAHPEPVPSSSVRYIQVVPKRFYSNALPDALKRFLSIPNPDIRLPVEASSRVFSREAIKKVCSLSSVKSLNYSGEMQAYVYVLKRHLCPWLPERPLSHGIVWALFPGTSNAEKNATGSATGLHLFVENAAAGVAQARTAVRYLYCGRYNLVKIRRNDEELGRTEGTEDRTEASRLLPKEWKNLTEQFRAAYADEIKTLFHISSQNEMAREFEAENTHIPLRLAQCIGYDDALLCKLLKAEAPAARVIHSVPQTAVIDISDD